MSHASWRKRMPSLISRPLRKIKRVISDRHIADLEKEVLKSQWLQEDMLRDLQLFHIRKLLRHAYKTTRYYRELFDSMGLQVEDIQSLSDYSQSVPVLEKSIVRERFEDLISFTWRNKYKIVQTSGSTGTPTKFAHPSPFPMHRAMWRLVDNMCGLEGNERTLHLWGGNLGGGRYHVFDRERNLARFSFYSMPPEGFEELLNFIVRWRPEFIYGGVSLLYTTAEALEKRGYTSLGAKVIQTHSEKLYDFQRRKIQKIFGGGVFVHYGSGEIYHFGVECQEHNGIHLFSNLRLFELEPISDKDSNTGEVLVTDFHNYAMPFLRYRIGDVLTVDNTTCRCGRSLPRATIKGRTIDIIRLRDGTSIDSTFFEKLMDPKQVNRFLVHQRTYDRIDIHIVPTASFTNDYRDDLIRKIKDKAKVEEIRLLLEKEIDVKIADKYRLVRSDISAQTVQIAAESAG